MHTRYAVKRLDGSFVGSRRFDYGRGSYAATSSRDHARLFTRGVDAERACEVGAIVVPVTLYFEDDPS